MKERIMELLNSSDYKASPARFIAKSIGSDDFVGVVKTLNQLEEEHLIIHDDRGFYGTLKYFNIYEGIIDLKDAGFGFVQVDGFEKDIFVKKNDTYNAMNGDIVYVMLTRPSRISFEGQVVEVIKRKRPFLIGKLKKKHNHYYLDLNDDNRTKVTIQPKNISSGKIGDIVKVIITDFGDGRLLKGKVDKVLADEKTSEVKIACISQIASSNIDTEFKSDVLNEALKLSDEEVVIGERKDLTNEFIVTIDGSTAKDFDDAINVKKLGKNKYQLGVYIADVSHYVKVSSAIDQEAFIRSFSCYFPFGVIPMLPSVLCDDLCSLKEGEMRYALGVEMIIEDGNVTDYDIFKCVIKSKARLTYDLVNEWLENEIPEDFSMLQDAYDLYQVLLKKRLNKGYLDFDISDVNIEVDDDYHPLKVEKAIRKDAERLIEEFMIITNNVVAETIYHMDLPFLYRVHSEPTVDKMKELKTKLSLMNIKIPPKQNKLTSKFFMDILNNFSDDNYDIVNRLLLRSMSKATYSDNNIGHFALSIDNYTHFTSPIRRYSDLVVHRLLKDYLMNENNYNEDLNLSEIGNHISNQEKIIDNLERDVLDTLKADYISKNIGKIFKGRISSIKSWGIYVELDNTIEGLVSSDNLIDLGYHFIEEKETWIKNNEFYLTQEVEVKVIESNIFKGQIDFILVGESYG